VMQPLLVLAHACVFPLNHEARRLFRLRAPRTSATSVEVCATPRHHTS
jgi:hypothetical protein